MIAVKNGSSEPRQYLPLHFVESVFPMRKIPLILNKTVSYFHELIPNKKVRLPHWSVFCFLPLWMVLEPVLWFKKGSKAEKAHVPFNLLPLGEIIKYDTGGLEYNGTQEDHLWFQ